MAIADMLKTEGRAKTNFECSKYDPVAGSKRCRHYLDNGACERPDEFMCVEWLKANGHKPAPTEPAPVSSKREEVDSRPARQPALPVPPRVVTQKPDEPNQPPPRGLTTEDIESFKALGAEVCLDTPHLGELWLVPEYTGKDRRELTPEHAATLYQVLAVFPGAQVVSFEKSLTTDEEEPS